MTKVNFSCKDCAERHVGCHSTCEKYLQEVKVNNEAREARRLHSLARQDYEAYKAGLKLGKKRKTEK